MAANSQARADLLVTLVSAGLFLYVGFGLGLSGISKSEIYNTSVTALVWGARGVGIAILASAAMTHWGLGAAALAELLVSVAATLLCLVVGGIWIAFSDRSGALLLLFGLFNAHAVRVAWLEWRIARRAASESSDAPPPEH